MSVLVLGMHRSGTSAATRVINLLGVPLCRARDLVPGHDGNERGHWESLPLVDVDEQLLKDLRARWWCPPDDPEEVAALTTDERRVAWAAETFAASHPTREWVWKDPRSCLLLPFWRRVLPDQQVAVVVHRDPVAVASSLHARSAVTVAFGLALWERYVASSVRGSHGLPTLYCSYESLLTDPIGWAQRVAEFLTVNGVRATLPASTTGITSFLSPDLRHASASADVQLTPTQARWRAFLLQRSLDQEAEEPDLIDDDDARALMNAVRINYGLQAPPSTPAPVRTDVVVPLQVADEPVTRRRPADGPMSVLLFPNGRAATAGDLLPLRGRFPPDAEFVTVADCDDPPGPSDDGPLLRVHRDRRLSLAQRLELAREVASGDVIMVLSGAPVTPQPGWLPRLRAALNAHPECAVVAPALCGTDGTAPVFGLTTDPTFVDLRWECTAPDDAGVFPVWAASLTAFLTTRRHLDGIGGFDSELSGVGREDLDLCLRFWRSGWQCLAVPAATVTVDLDTPPGNDVDLLVNVIRLGMVHLSREQLDAQIADLAACEGFVTALARLTASDAGRRRGVIEARAWYSTEELCHVTGLEMKADELMAAGQRGGTPA